MRIKLLLCISALLLILQAQADASPKKDPQPDKRSVLQMIDKGLEHSRSQALFLAETLIPMENKLPRTYQNDKLYVTDYSAWTSGFYPGPGPDIR